LLAGIAQAASNECRYRRVEVPFVVCVETEAELWGERKRIAVEPADDHWRVISKLSIDEGCVGRCSQSLDRSHGERSLKSVHPRSAAIFVETEAGRRGSEYLNVVPVKVVG